MQTEVTLAQYGKDIEYMKDKIEEIHEGQKSLSDKLDGFIKSADDKYAPKSLINDVAFLRNLLVVTILGGILISLVAKIFFK